MISIKWIVMQNGDLWSCSSLRCVSRYSFWSERYFWLKYKHKDKEQASRDLSASITFYESREIMQSNHLFWWLTFTLTLFCYICLYEDIDSIYQTKLSKRRWVLVHKRWFVSNSLWASVHEHRFVIVGLWLLQSTLAQQNWTEDSIESSATKDREESWAFRNKRQRRASSV